MKRPHDTFFLYLFCLMLLPLLAGCGQSHSTPPPIQPPDSSPTITMSNFDAAEKPITITYKQPPRRVVVTHPGATELLLELGLERHIFSTIAPYGASLDRVADKYAQLNIMQAPFTPAPEELFAMQPDMIIGWAHHFDESTLGTVKTWQERGVGTYIVPSSLTKIQPTMDNVVYAAITDIGRIFGIQEKANHMIEHYKKRVAAVEHAVKQVPQRKSVLILQDHFNGTFSLYGSNYLISQMVDIAGGYNICKTQSSFVGAERVLALDPDVILFVSVNKSDTRKDLTDNEALEHVKNIKELQSMRAIREGNIIQLPFFTVNNGGVRTIDAIESIARKLYPEQMQ